MDPNYSYDLERLKSACPAVAISLFDAVDSTNSLASSLEFQSGSSSPAWILAHEQRLGRGRSHRRWYSDRGNFTGSFVFQFDFREFEQRAPDWTFAAALSMATAIAVHQTVSQFLPNRTVSIKWPNDILVDHQKVAGILIENQLLANSTSTFDSASPKTAIALSTCRCVLGVGINVNRVPSFDKPQSNLACPPAPDGVEPNDSNTLAAEDDLNSPCAADRGISPISLASCLGQSVSLSDVAVGLTQHLLETLELGGLLQAEHGPRLAVSLETLLARYNRWLAFRGEPVEIRHWETAGMAGICEEVDSKGRLVLKQTDGTRILASTDEGHLRQAR